MFLACHNYLMVRKRSKHLKPDTQIARALARWESEGGALQASSPSDRQVANILAEPERHVLERLGAALVIAWNELPTDVQRSIFRQASTVGRSYDPVQLRERIARFLHDHKDDAEEN